MPEERFNNSSGGYITGMEYWVGIAVVFAEMPITT